MTEKKKMSANTRKTKGKTFETQIADKIHNVLYENNIEYRTLYNSMNNDQIKPRRDSSSGTFKISTGDIELGLAQKFFPYSIECKHWASLDLSIHYLYKNNGKKIVDVYVKQCKPVAEKRNLKPLVVFKANRTETFALVEYTNKIEKDFIYYFKFDNYIIIPFDEFLNNIVNNT